MTDSIILADYNAVIFGALDITFLIGEIGLEVLLVVMGYLRASEPSGLVGYGGVIRNSNGEVTAGGS